MYHPQSRPLSPNCGPVILLLACAHVKVDVAGGNNLNLHNVWWVDEALVTTAEDNATLFRLLADSEKHYIQTISNLLDTVLVPLRSVDWLADADVDKIVDPFEKECVLHKTFLVDVARESSRPHPDDMATFVTRWAAALVVSCTAVSAIGHKCEFIIAKSARPEDAKEFLAKHCTRGTLTDIFTLSKRRMHECLALVIRLQELVDQTEVSDLLAVLTVASTACDTILGRPDIEGVLVDDAEVGGPLILVSRSVDVQVGAEPQAPADLLVYEGIMLVVRPPLSVTPTDSTRTIIARCALRMASVKIDEAAACKVTIEPSNSPENTVVIRFSDSRACAVWSGELYDQTIDRPPGVELLLLSSIRPFSHHTNSFDDKVRVY